MRQAVLSRGAASKRTILRVPATATPHQLGRLPGRSEVRRERGKECACVYVCQQTSACMQTDGQTDRRVLGSAFVHRSGLLIIMRHGHGHRARLRGRVAKHMDHGG
jgi:hypothetical protein